MYIKLLNGTTLVENLHLTSSKRTQFTGSYVSINVFREYYNSVESKDLAKIYKESYFQCDRMEYDGEAGRDGSARVQKMYFTQIREK